MTKVNNWAKSKSQFEIPADLVLIGMNFPNRNVPSPFQSSLNVHAVHSPMRLCLILLLLLGAVFSALALTDGEVLAVEAFYRNFPALQTTTPPWQTNGTLACTKPVFYGLTCSDGPDPHITTLYESSLAFNSKVVSVGLQLCSRISSYLTLTLYGTLLSRSFDILLIGEVPSEVGELFWLQH